MSQEPAQQKSHTAPPHRHRVLLIGLLTLTLLVPLMIYRSWSSPPPGNLGIHDGQLSPCPSSPNCVCSQAVDPDHAIAAIPLSANRQRQWKALQQILDQQPRATLVTVSDDYLHAEFRSLVFRFVDDVEFLIDANAQVIHLRSASRTGYSDLGVNRARVEHLRQALEQAMTASSD